MPEYPAPTQTKLDALQALTGADRKPAEIVAIYWPSPTGTKVYSSAMYTELPWWPALAAAITAYFGTSIPITLTLIPDGTPFIDLPRAASVSDDSINLTFSDLDDEFSDLLMDYGEGLRCEVFGYWPTVDLLLSMWRGMLHQPKEMNRDQVKITATAGWRAPQMLVPKRPFATSCPFIFGALLSSQAEIDHHNGCPYNVHIGGSIGVPGFTDCPRRVKADCVDRLATEVYWPGFETREDPIPNNQTQGPNLLAKAIGNESMLSDPIRVIAGERYVKALYLLAFRNETNTNHPDQGFGAALFAVSEGTNLAMWEFRINGQLVGAAHFQLRLGALGQPPSGWSPDVNSYSGTAHCWGRIQGGFDNAVASDYSGSIRVLGAAGVRVYSDPNTYVERYTTNRAWWLLEVLAEARWGYGQDYPRFDVQSFIDAATWCDEYVTLTDPNGNTFSGVRSTFNAEVTARAIQQQVKDICTAGRLGIPFEFEGKDVVVPLKAEDLGNPNIPTLTDEGPNRNVVYDGSKSSLSWSVISDETMTNQWTVNFDEAVNGGVDTQYIFGDQAQQLRAGRAWGDRSKRVVNKSQAGYGINSAQEAARFGNSLLYLGPLDSGGILNPFSVKFVTWYSEAFNVQNYKLIKVVNVKLQSRMAAYFTARGLEPYPGADYTYFRVMKYTRKGDLRVEIEAQQYATLEIAITDPCGPQQCSTVLAEPFSRDDGLLGIAPNSETWEEFGIGGVWSIDGRKAQAVSSFDGSHSRNGIAVVETGVSNGSVEITIKAIIPGIYLQSYGVAFRAVDEDNYWYCTYRSASNSLALYVVTAGGEGPSTGFGSNVDPITPVVGDKIRVAFCGNEIRCLFNGVEKINHSSTTHNTATRHGIQTRLGDAALDDFIVRTGDFTNPTDECLDPDTFSAPRALTASVNASTGLVHFHWSPPTMHPEIVTGYTLYEADEVTVAMPTNLVYSFELTLAPGTYTYNLNATDGLTVSGFASVTFDVPAPPVDLGLIDRDTGNTLVDRISGDTLESR